MNKDQKIVDVTWWLLILVMGGVWLWWLAYGSKLGGWVSLVFGILVPLVFVINLIFRIRAHRDTSTIFQGRSAKQH